MTSIMVHLVCGSNLTFENGYLVGNGSSRSIFILSERISFLNFVDMAYNQMGVSREFYNLKFFLWYFCNGNLFKSEIGDDAAFNTIYWLSNQNQQFVANFEVQFMPVPQSSQMGFLEQLQGITSSFQQVGQTGDCFASTSYQATYNNTRGGDDEEDDAAENEEGGGDEPEDGGPSDSESSLSGHEPEEQISEDEGGLEVEPHQQTLDPIRGFGHEIEVISDRLPFEEDDEELDFWNKEIVSLRKGMFFRSKAELLFAVRRWNIRSTREIHVKESKPYTWSACCQTQNPNYRGTPQEFPCTWLVSASTRNKHGVWRISKWIDSHSCFGSVVGNNNRSLSASMIADDIAGQIQTNIAFPVNNIIEDVKKNWNVDVTYDKAWNARRIAIERMFGTWQNNFDELPKYIHELLRSNPRTIVRWLHHPSANDNGTFTFKYIFWAFGPAIRAFQTCIPVICVDGTHLRGNYKGKLLTAVTKNANGNLLPVAFAMVDNETNESWSWFLRVFRATVAVHSDRALCVISDRHQGCINAMEEMPDWHHRYCLRHIRSNLMAKFKVHKLKGWCWQAGSTTEKKRYIHAVRKIKEIEPEAWDYLKEIGLERWTQYRDTDYRRWGNLTTNIAESLNNVIRSARMLPIKACIEYTFEKLRHHIVKHSQEATNWRNPLSKSMWRLYQVREDQSTMHRVRLFSARLLKYNVISGVERTQNRASKFKVLYGDQNCTCGVWQTQRFICSHGLAVRGHLDKENNQAQPVDPTTMVSEFYLRSTWRKQYLHTLNPLRDADYWAEANWTIQVDETKIITHRGRRQLKRIPNEMDQPSGPRRQKCGICNESGHNRARCPNRNLPPN